VPDGDSEFEFGGFPATIMSAFEWLPPFAFEFVPPLPQPSSMKANNDIIHTTCNCGDRYRRTCPMALRFLVIPIKTILLAPGLGKAGFASSFICDNLSYW